MPTMSLLRRTVLVAFVALAACSPKAATSAPATAVQDVTISQYGDLLIYLPLYIAQDQKFFEKEGLRVKFINGGGDDKTYASLAAGAAQFGVSDPTFTAIAREKGQKAVVVGTVVAGATYWGVTWNPDIKETRDVAGLKDLRIATYESPSTNYALMAKSLSQKKAEVGAATIVQGSYGSLLAMLKAGRADVAMELEPAVSTAVAEGAHVVFSYPEMYGPFLLTGLYVLEDYRDKNPATVQAAVNAVELAMRYAHANPEGAIAIAQRKFPEVHPQVIRTAVTRMVSDATLPAHVTMDQKGWANAVNVRVELGDLKDASAADQALDPSFAAKSQAIQ